MDLRSDCDNRGAPIDDSSEDSTVPKRGTYGDDPVTAGSGVEALCSCLLGGYPRSLSSEGCAPVLAAVQVRVFVLLDIKLKLSPDPFVVADRHSPFAALVFVGDPNDSAP